MVRYPLLWFALTCSVNYLGLIRCCKAFLPMLKRQAIQGIYRGRILNLTSSAGLVWGLPGLSAYSSSKHAANIVSDYLRLELKTAFGIPVVTVNPSFHDTPMVNGMKDYADQQWENEVSPEKKQEYGQDFYRQMRHITAEKPRMVTWNANLVVQQVIELLKAKHPPAQVIIGSDARFIFLVLRMLPAWCVDLIFANGLNRYPVPAAMQENK